MTLGLVVFYALGLDRHASLGALRENREWLLAWSEEERTLAPLLYLAVYAAVVSFSLPGGALLTIVGGFLFGTVAATCYTVVGATTGATLLFLAARTALGGLLRAKVGSSLGKLEAGFRENQLAYMFVLRLVPLFPFWLVNLVPAFLGVSLRTYVVATFFGIIPGVVVFASIGNGLGALLDEGREPELGIILEPEIIGPILGLAALALVPVLYKSYKARRSRHRAGT
ncbi:MAG: TVP38/TMEM64 family protein [Alphaproteobacteria bacterium]